MTARQVGVRGVKGTAMRSLGATTVLIYAADNVQNLSHI